MPKHALSLSIFLPLYPHSLSLFLVFPYLLSFFCLFSSSFHLCRVVVFKKARVFGPRKRAAVAAVEDVVAKRSFWGENWE
jgi:hypothetical protein